MTHPCVRVARATTAPAHALAILTLLLDARALGYDWRALPIAAVAATTTRPRATVAVALAWLARAGVVERRRDGRGYVYRLPP